MGEVYAFGEAGVADWTAPIDPDAIEESVEGMRDDSRSPVVEDKKGEFSNCFLYFPLFLHQLFSSFHS